MRKRSIIFLVGLFVALNCVTGVKADTEQLNEKTIRRTAWSPDGTRLAIADYTPTIEIWDAVEGKHLLDLPGQANYAFILAWSPDGQRLASSSWDQNGINIWDTSSGELLISIDEDPQIATLVWLDKSKILAGEEGNHGLHVWDAESGKLIRTYEDISAGFEAVLSHDGNTLAVIPGIYASLLDMNTFKFTHVFSLVSDFEQDYQAWVMDWPLTTDTLAVGYMNGRVRIWDVEKTAILEELQANESPVERFHLYTPVLSGVMNVAYSLNGESLYAVSADGTIRGWQVSDGNTYFDAKFNDIIYDAAWNPTHTVLAIGTTPHPNISITNEIDKTTLRDGSLYLIQYEDLATHIA